nr:phosphopentomutase [Limnochorda pilosa]
MDGMAWKRAVVLVLDSVGIGALPDADRYGDEGSNTVGNTARAVGGLKVPTLNQLGLGHLVSGPGLEAVPEPLASYGRMAERAPGKDTTTGHWELMGCTLDRPMPTYPDGFPPEVIERFEAAIGRKVLGNRPASGTVIIQELGDEHVRTGSPIVYTSADSVFQIAAHEEVIPLEELYRMCQIAREILQGEHAVGRVIARPFLGPFPEEGPDGVRQVYRRTTNRRDFSLAPPRPTLLDRLQEAGLAVHAVGKISDIFAGRGITNKVAAPNNQEVLEATLELIRTASEPGLIFANCVDFDTLWGHRNDVQAYAAGLEAVDRFLPRILEALGPEDRFIITADHGCDPTTPSTDHSREYVPVLWYAPGYRGVSLGTRATFADLGATLAEGFCVGPLDEGTSFLSQLPEGRKHGAAV